MPISHRGFSLAPLAQAYGGDVSAGGLRALIPAPGHTAADRSVSLRLVAGRVLVHSFGGADWREVLDMLRADGWIDAENGLSAGGGRATAVSAAPEPSQRERVAAAQALWEQGAELRPADPATLYGLRRGIDLLGVASPALRSHAAVPAAVYRGGGPYRPALLAAVSEPGGLICAVEITYLDMRGRLSRSARPPRKIVGALPAGCAVRLMAADGEMAAGEGVFTSLSAAKRFGRPAWALLSTSNLRRWTPPRDVRRLLIAGDRGWDGERSARMLRRRARRAGVDAWIELPPPGAGDWNDLDQVEGRRKGG